MGLGDFFKGRSRRREIRRPDDLITAYDERGRQIQIRRRDWVEGVLAPHVDQAWNDPDELSRLIVQSLNDELPEQVADAADRLVELDAKRTGAGGPSERALTLAAVVKMELDDLVGAERALKRSIAEHGSSGIVLTNLAKVLDRRREREASLATLRRGLELDPNQDTGLLWYAALARERGGDAAYLSALEEVAAFAGAWRPQLWIAREKLQQGDRGAAFALYEQVLARAPEDADALMMVTGDLGKAGALEDVARMATPRYKADVHGFPAGANLLQALKDLGRYDEARELLQRLQAIGGSPFASYLAEMEDQIARATLPATPSAPPELVCVHLDSPVWLRGLYGPEWLLPHNAEGSPTIELIALTDETRSGTQPETQTIDDRGRLTRALPLYLAEVLRLRYGLPVGYRLFVARGIGPAVVAGGRSREEWEAALRLADGPSSAPTAPAGRRLFVAGSLVSQGLRLQVWDPDSTEAPTSIAIDGTPAAAADLVRDGEQAVLAALESRAPLPKPRMSKWYWPPPDALLAPYVLALDQTLTLMLAANQLMPRTAIWNERGYFETCFGLVDTWTDPPESARLLAIYAVTAAVAYGSRLVEPYKKIVLDWLDAARPGSALRRLAPAILQRLDERDRLARCLANLPSAGDAGYAAWLDRVKGGDAR